MLIGIKWRTQVINGVGIWKSRGLEVVLLVTTVLAPVIGGALNCVTKLTLNRRQFEYSFLISSVALLSLFNALKIPESDLADYLLYYHELNGISIAYFLDRFGSEPIFYLFSWVIGLLTNFSDYWFKYLSSFFGLLTFAYGGLRYSRIKLKRLDAAVVLSLVALCCFPAILSNSLHLIRQFFALGIFVLGLSFFGKLRFLLWTIAILTHVSSVILIVFAISGKTARFIQILAALTILFLGAIAPLLRTYLGGVDLGTVSYFFSRLSQESFHEMAGLGNIHIVFVCLVMMLCLVPRGTWIMGLLRVEAPELRQVLFALGAVILLLTLVYDFREPAARLFFYFIALVLLSFIIKVGQLGRGRMLLSVVYLAASLTMAVPLLLGAEIWSYDEIEFVTLLSPLFYHVL